MVVALEGVDVGKVEDAVDVGAGAGAEVDADADADVDVEDGAADSVEKVSAGAEVTVGIVLSVGNVVDGGTDAVVGVATVEAVAVNPVKGEVPKTDLTEEAYLSKLDLVASFTAGAVDDACEALEPNENRVLGAFGLAMAAWSFEVAVVDESGAGENEKVDECAGMVAAFGPKLTEGAGVVPKVKAGMALTAGLLSLVADKDTDAVSGSWLLVVNADGFADDDDATRPESNDTEERDDLSFNAPNPMLAAGIKLAVVVVCSGS